MSVDGTKLLFESFLQKRKDTMKLRWVTYWFRLQNTTLFFYTQKNGSALHLRGNYYIYTVQSVREVLKADSKRFMFEIIMTNGKRKLLAADTAALRQQWVGYLWQAMHLSTSRASESRSSHPEVHEHRERVNSSAPTCSQSNRVTVSLPARPLSAPAPTGHIHHEIRSNAFPFYQSEELASEENSYQNILPACNYQDHSGDTPSIPHWSSELTSGEGQEGDYDVLPVRKTICESNASTEMDEEDVYDFPLSNRRADEHPESLSDPTEDIYDVPSSLLRMTEDPTEEQLEDGVYWRI
ncbi:uncharacterized protein LOC118323529 [Morone saxatilis]|uniref:uncharacterized protein LOC118323529 n=1 Tax=Morone saxatilis TaxID=34816 RepID=UPI0015E207E3|nr:uncharacterized protein LOC118323529 [Morone saxatilis]